MLLKKSRYQLTLPTMLQFLNQGYNVVDFLYEAYYGFHYDETGGVLPASTYRYSGFILLDGGDASEVEISLNPEKGSKSGYIGILTLAKSNGEIKRTSVEPGSTVKFSNPDVIMFSTGYYYNLYLITSTRDSRVLIMRDAIYIKLRRGSTVTKTYTIDFLDTFVDYKVVYGRYEVTILYPGYIDMYLPNRWGFIEFKEREILSEGVCLVALTSREIETADIITHSCFEDTSYIYFYFPPSTEAIAIVPSNQLDNWWGAPFYWAMSVYPYPKLKPHTEVDRWP